MSKEAELDSSRSGVGGKYTKSDFRGGGRLPGRNMGTPRLVAGVMRSISVITFGLLSIMLMGRDPREDNDELPDEGLCTLVTCWGKELGGVIAVCELGNESS